MNNIDSEIKKLLKEAIDINYFQQFPINNLVKVAKHFDNFKDFEHNYGIDINHGYFWHITNNPNFKIDPSTGPRDLSSMSEGGTANGALMVTSDLAYWDFHYNNYEDPEEYGEENTEKITRPHAALIDLSDIDPRKIKQVGRGFGNEIYIWPTEARLAKVIKVVTIQEARNIDKKLYGLMPQSERELKKIWLFAHGKSK